MDIWSRIEIVCIARQTCVIKDVNQKLSSCFRLSRRISQGKQIFIRASGLMNGRTRYINRDTSVVSRIANSVISSMKGTIGILFIRMPKSSTVIWSMSCG
jgi:hypothetical protein